MLMKLNVANTRNFARNDKGGRKKFVKHDPIFSKVEDEEDLPVARR